MALQESSLSCFTYQLRLFALSLLWHYGNSQFQNGCSYFPIFLLLLLPFLTTSMSCFEDLTFVSPMQIFIVIIVSVYTPFYLCILTITLSYLLIMP
jgi:hypothetical protein